MSVGFGTSRRSAAWAGLVAGVLVAPMFAAGCGEPAPPPPPPAPAAPVAKSPEARVQWYQDCWRFFNEKAWDQFQNCYAADAVSEAVDSTPPSTTGRAAIVEHAKLESNSFPDRRGEVRLIVANGDNIASIALFTGTNSGPMPGPDGKEMPATGKSIGLLIGHTLQWDPTGNHAVRDADYVDEGTLTAQLGLNPAPARKAEKATGAAAQVVIARNDDKEAANLAATERSFADMNKHDLKAMGADTPDDYKMMEIGRPTDIGKKEALAGMKEMFSAFPDITFTTQKMWAAGDYVVVEGTLNGTNTGDMPSMGLKKTGKKVTSRFFEVIRYENGKPKEDWLFYNGAAFAAQLGLK